MIRYRSVSIMGTSTTERADARLNDRATLRLRHSLSRFDSHMALLFFVGLKQRLRQVIAVSLFTSTSAVHGDFGMLALKVS
jgi:hypothetical protein